MSDAPIVPAETVESLEKAILHGDLKKLSPQERIQHYRSVCESLGLNPLTQPFAYIELQGKLKLYALRSCTEQLRKIHRISVDLEEPAELGDVYKVKAIVSTPDGRRDQDIGVVPIKGLSGDALANALMKAVTKAKRRATLGVCGLAFLDESELDTVPQAKRVDTERDQREPPQLPTARPRVDSQTGEVLVRPEGSVPLLPGGPCEGFRMDDTHNVPREYLKKIATTAQDEHLRAWARWLTAKVVQDAG